TTTWVDRLKALRTAPRQEGLTICYRSPRELLEAVEPLLRQLRPDARAIDAVRRSGTQPVLDGGDPDESAQDQDGTAPARERPRRAVPPPPTTICARTWWCCHRWPRRASSSTTCWSTTLTGSRPSTGSRRSTWLSPAPPAPSQSRSGGASSVISDPPGSGAGWHEGRCAGAGDRCDPRPWSMWPTIPAARWPT